MRLRTISAEERLRCSPGFRRVVRMLQRGLGVEKSLEDESPGRRRVVYKDASCPGCFLSFLSFSTQPLHKNSTVSSLVFCPRAHSPLSAPCLCPLSSVLCPLSSGLGPRSSVLHTAPFRPPSSVQRAVPLSLSRASHPVTVESWGPQDQRPN